MNLHLIGCEVLRDELTELGKQVGTTLTIHLLEQGLHNEPEKLRQQLQLAIDEVEKQPGDAIVLGYGVCCRGIDGLGTQTRPLIVPRAHDCITLLLGSKEQYADYVAKNPGTYWYSPGWNRCHIPPGKERHEKCRKRYVEQFGEDNADYLMEMEQGWFAKYDRATYVHLTVGATAQDKQYTKDCADWLNWNYDEIEGDPKLVLDMLSGDWDDERFLVVPPGKKVRLTADDRIVDAAEPEDASTSEEKEQS